MKSIKVWLASARWLCWAVLAGGLFILGVVARGLLLKKTKTGDTTIPEVVRKKVEAAEEAALIRRIEASAVATAKSAELGNVLKIDDGAERRKRLAELLRSA